MRLTYERLKPLVDRVMVVTEARQVSSLKDELDELADEDFIVEPVARGTANAYGLAAHAIAKADPLEVLLISAADHVVSNDDRYRDAVRRALEVAETTGKLVAIGLKPTYPATGFGYIRAAASGQVEEFVEKPSLEKAEAYLESGRYFWNLSMFAWRAQAFLDELAATAPELSEGLQKATQNTQAYKDLPNEAVDYAVLEKSRNLLLVPAGFDWLDVGSWAELHDLMQADELGNTVHGEPALIDTKGSLLSAPGKLVAAIGVEDLIVVDTEHALLVLPKHRAQEVKRLVQLLKESGRTRYL